MNKILFFPEPYPDEDFRSVIFRYHIRSGNSEFKETKKELFDVASEKVGIFPRNLKAFLNKMPYENFYTKEDVLSSTWLPFLSAYLPKDRLYNVNKDIMFGNTGACNYVGKVDSQRHISLLSNGINYCPICIKEDFGKFGECYIHLQHQISFINFCPIHLVNLITECLKCGKHLSNKYASYLTIRPCCNYSEVRKIEVNSVIKFKLKLLLQVNYFKQNNKMSSEVLFAKIYILLGNNNYINVKGDIRKSKLFDDMIGKYQEDCLTSIGFTRDALNWKFLNYNYMANFSFFYILLIWFLAGSVEKFLTNTQTYSNPLPFGSGPWPCHNTICPTYKKKKTITNCNRTLLGNTFTGRFVCPVCGHKYTRKYYEDVGESDDQYYVTDMGHLWRLKVIELYYAGNNINETAKILNASSSTVSVLIRKYLNKQIHISKVCVDDELFAKSEVAATDIQYETREKYREKIRGLKVLNNKISRVYARKIANKEYSWLYKNDLQWLNDFLPSKRRELNYSILDEQLQVKVREVAKRIYASNPPTRIKKYTILNELDLKDRNQMCSHKEKFPKALAELDSHIETIEDYQVRHVPSIFFQLKSAGYVNVTVNSVLAFRRSYRKCSNTTKRRIEEVLDKLKKQT